MKVAVDDFGTGYTSLAHLQRLPIDIIKIDRTFISELNHHRGSSLVRMVTDLGHAIDLTIIAEGVETGQELRTLQEMVPTTCRASSSACRSTRPPCRRGPPWPRHSSAEP